MNWKKYLDWGPTPPRRVRKIEVKALGIPKVVFVRTKHNGGIKVRKIEVKYVQAKAVKKTVRQQLVLQERPARG